MAESVENGQKLKLLRFVGFMQVFRVKGHC